eukprot:CAMPEP_0204902838 /NCGR_PEP_ID=MMETSP1397-20131031/3912_1 /ASSEMBLY_ACC=CAM_ASM_000891 /TAXON_ID=49980 /ORGANISM="Climacostomum Climacostomum virens, Strain Stock W-24" /LENGTH=401 /DNA_ID=CAMNT_0052071405 /DNA_START=293 /DNA_END=1498 /DNA_ORIENTATION=-
MSLFVLLGLAYAKVSTSVVKAPDYSVVSQFCYTHGEGTLVLEAITTQEALRGFVIPIIDLNSLSDKLKSDYCLAGETLAWRDFRLLHSNQSFYEQYKIENEGENFCLSIILAACPEEGASSSVDAAFYAEFKNKGARMYRQFSEEDRGFLPMFLAFSLVWGGLGYIHYLSYSELQLMEVSSHLVGLLNVIFISGAGAVLSWLVYFFVYSVEGMCPMLLNITGALAELIQESAIVVLLVCHASGYFLQAQEISGYYKAALVFSLFLDFSLQVYRVYYPGDLITFDFIPLWFVLFAYRNIVAFTVAVLGINSNSFNTKLVASPLMYNALIVLGITWLVTLPSICLFCSMFSRLSRKLVEASIKMVSDSVIMAVLLFLTYPSRVSQIFVSSLPSLGGKFYYSYT